MKVYPISNMLTFHSKVQDDEFVLGFDDEISKKRRDIIREHFDSYQMPYYSIYEKEPRKTEYEMDTLLKTMINKPKKVDYKTMMTIPVFNVMPIGDNSYRGATLAYKPNCLPVLKKANINRVIDLYGSPTLEKSVKDAGLEYFNFQISNVGFDDYFWDNDAFNDKESYARKILRYYSPEEIEREREFFMTQIENFEKSCRPFIDKFVQFIRYMQEGYNYIGCEFGTYSTDDALLLNDIFNPLEKVEDPWIKDPFKIDSFRCLYAKLTEKDKALMKWTKEFDKNFLPKLKKAEEKLINIQLKNFLA